MPTGPKKDNSTIDRKVALRRQALRGVPLDAPILETHGGYGRIFERVYYRHRGVVLEKDDRKVALLARQRPAWRVYHGLAEKALAAGLANDVPFSFIDLDPYGSPFDVLDAIFQPGRALAPKVELVVNDGMRNKVRVGGAWHVHCLREIVERHGNDLLAVYLDVAREMVEKIAQRVGYVITAWKGYYCGSNNDMTHYHATLERQ